MKLFTNSGNSSTLKVLISANHSKTNLELEVVEIDDARFQKPRRLPVLESDDGDHIFSTNSAAHLVFSPENIKQKFDVDSWLEWEAVKLQPTLIKCIGSKYDSVSLSKLLDKLDKVFSKQPYLVEGDLISVCDISVWCTLYPILTDSKLSSSFSNKYSNVDKWFKKLHQTSEFKEALSQYKVPEGVECLQNVSSSSWYPSVAVKDSAEVSPAHLASNISNNLILEVSGESVTDAELKEVEEFWLNGKLIETRKQHHPILPIAGERNILITSALPYVNNVPHLGNIIGCVLSADVFSRYCRLRNWNTLFLCGTDEYGTATETKALEEGLTPQQICDKYFQIHKETYEWFSIDFDRFGRTSTPQQTEIVQDFFKKVHGNGYTSVQQVEQLFCDKCKRFLADRFVEGICPRCSYNDARGDQCDGCGHLINAIELIQPKCKICSATPAIQNSQHFFLELPKVEDKVKEWMATVSGGWTHNARMIANSWLKDGLKARCITRDLKWGIPVPLPGFEQKVFYVWFDAVLGYISITKSYTEHWRKWWEKDESRPVTYYQFMAKDNVPFHSIIFPSILLASGGDGKYNLVNHLMATEYLNYEDGKFSKSRGVGVFGTDAKQTGIPSDIFRFYLLYMRPEGQDSAFSWVDFAIKNNSELLNNLGNFINRALVFVDKFFGGVIPEMKLTKDDYTVLVYITRELKGYINALDKGKLRDGIKHILSLSKVGNFYLQEAQPWVLIKGNEHDKVKAGTVIGVSCNLACLLALLMKPYMPQTVEVISKQLNVSSDLFVLTSRATVFLKPGHKIGKPAPLFAKLEQSVVDDLKKRFAGKQQPQEVSKNNKIPSQVNDEKKKETVLNSVPTSSACASELEAAITKQGDLVRSLKSSGVPRSEWQPQVNVLLEMKKQLAEMKASIPSLSDLQDKVTKQGDLVRQLKSSGVPRTEWQPQVNVLLELKKQLAAAQQLSANNTS